MKDITQEQWESTDKDNNDSNVFQTEVSPYTNLASKEKFYLLFPPAVLWILIYEFDLHVYKNNK